MSSMEELWHWFLIDLFDPLVTTANCPECILTVVGMAFRSTEVEPFNKITAETIHEAPLIYDISTRVRIQNDIQSDKGQQSVSNF